MAVVVSHAFEADGYHKGDVGGARGDRRHAKTARRTDVIGHQNTTKKHDDSGCRWLDLNGLFLGSHGLPVKKETLSKAQKQLGGLSALIDLWWRTGAPRLGDQSLREQGVPA